LVSHLKDVFIYKELLINLAVKELKVKYKNSVLGFFWSLINPIFTMLIFTIVFSMIFKFAEIEYFPIFLLAGLLPWNFFNATVMGGTESIISNSSLVKKVYFPRELLPLSISLANLVNFFLELLVFLAFIGVIGIFSPQYLGVFKFLPLLLLLLPILYLFSVGFSFFISSINVYYRDVQHIMGIFMMALFYMSPIIYPISLIPEKYSGIYYINPLASIILSFKNTLYWMEAPQLNWIAYSFLIAIIFFIAGYAIFLRLEPDFAEEL